MNLGDFFRRNSELCTYCTSQKLSSTFPLLLRYLCTYHQSCKYAGIVACYYGNAGATICKEKCTDYLADLYAEIS